MKRLKELTLYDQSIQKLEFYLYHIELLKQKQAINLNDQIMINLLLNVFKSSMEYSIKYLRNYNKINKKINSYIPNKNDFKNDEKFYNVLEQRFGVRDEKGRTIFDNLFSTNLYNEFNKMQNNEKHSSINIHRKNIIENSGSGVYGNNIVINNNAIIRNEDSDSKGIVIDDKEIDITKNEGYTYEEVLYFEYNNREVFSFLDEVYHMVNNFVLDIKEYIGNRRDERGRY